MQSNRSIWLMVLSTVLLVGAAFFTLRAAEQATGHPAPAVKAAPTPAPARDTPASHPPPSAPEESATIADDPTTAPDPAQSADNNVSFPTDI